MGSVQGKVWGSTQQVFGKANVEVHRIEGIAGGYCSIHYHEHKFNLFFVESGVLELQEWTKGVGSDKPIDVTTLTAGSSHYIEPGIRHRFIVLKDCVVYEIYWTELSEDIIRIKDGGKEERLNAER